MPIYEYQCQQCHHRLEILKKMSDAPLVTCPACGQDALKKLVSAAAFRLKGSGWYETDFKQDGKRNLAGDAPNKSESGKSDKKSDSTGDNGTGTSADSAQSGKSDAAGTAGSTVPKSGTSSNSATSSSSGGSA